MNRPVKVLYDHQVFSWQKFGGISRYIVELIRHMPTEAVTAMLPRMLTENVYLRDMPDHVALNARSWDFANYRVRKKLYEAVNRFTVGRSLDSLAPDVLHPTYYDPYYMRRRKQPVVITVHDFTHERFPELLPDAKRVIHNKRLTVNAADRIIAISENTSRDIQEFYGIPSDRITVIHHGYTPFTADREVPVRGLPRRYVLFVGERGGYKNFATFAQAFALLADKDRELHMICAGRPFSPEEERMLTQLGVKDRSMAFFAEPRQLGFLYHQAECLVYPSLYEGFGLPILEAFAAKCPIALSRASCFPEIAGDAAEWFDPNDPADMAAAIGRVIYDYSRGDELVEAGTERLAQFSWDTTARRTADVYTSLVGD